MSAYPPAPWHLHGSMWLSLFQLGRGVDAQHPAGLYAAALVDYREPSPLAYRELLVARAVRSGRGGLAATVTDIWVDSPASRAGGRELWAIPKELADLDQAVRSGRASTRTRWSVSRDGRPVADAELSDLSPLAPRLPYALHLAQPGVPEHPEAACVGLRGSAKVLPCRARWRIAADGPVAFLRQGRQLGSLRLSDFRLTFG